jgi:hypothetical protein
VPNHAQEVPEKRAQVGFTVPRDKGWDLEMEILLMILGCDESAFQIPYMTFFEEDSKIWGD